MFGTVVIPQELSYAGCPVLLFYSIWACLLLVHQMKKKSIAKSRDIFLSLILGHALGCNQCEKEKILKSLCISFRLWLDISDIDRIKFT
jgi:L-cystine uptake protein TcyP (sodium:dicarboxylate symporter family)